MTHIARKKKMKKIVVLGVGYGRFKTCSFHYIPLSAVAEAVKLARRALLDRHGRLLRASAGKVPSLAAA